MALVRGVMRDSMLSGQLWKVLGSQSEKTATAPRGSTAEALTTKESEGTMTSSPALTPAAREGEFHGDGAVGNAQAVRRTLPLGEIAFEGSAFAGVLALDVAAAPPAAAVKDFEEGLFLGFIEDRPFDAEAVGENLGTTMKCQLWTY